VAVIGAGPYGLSVAAHLKAAGVHTQIFGEPMGFWRQNMPKGMNVRSPLCATDLSDPSGAFSLRQYARRNGIELRYPIPREELLRYGAWFQDNAVGEVIAQRVTRIERMSRGFGLTLADGDRVCAGRVVLAMGLANQEYRPDAFAGLPPSLVSHTCEHDDLSRFRGCHVAVSGRGQSACESARLLTEGGAETDLICRGPIQFFGGATNGPRDKRDGVWLAHQVISAPSGVGPFPLNWLNELPCLI